MAPRITVIGGGSHQWVPKLVTDVANTPTLHGAELVLEDIDAARLPRMAAYVEHVARVRGIPLSVRYTSDQRAALDGADYVVVTISTGGFDSMRHDLDVPARYGIRQSVGDTVGPGGIARCLRNVPVLVGIARDMEGVCPDAWLLNLTNPMTTLCRAVTRETTIRTVGLCHEVTITRFLLCLLLSASFDEVNPTVVGVNHLPVITALDLHGDDGLARLRALLGDEAALAQPLGFSLGDGRAATKGILLEEHRVKLELFQRFGVLPGAGDRHLVEFFAGFLTEAAGWGKRWGVKLTPIEDREADERGYVAELDAELASDEISSFPSGEMVAPLIDSLIRDVPQTFPLNLPNRGQAPDLPDGVVVETMCVADGSGVRPGPPASLPPGLAEHVRRVSASQELCVEAALRGDRNLVFSAMLEDPLAGRLDYDQLDALTTDLLDATRSWLPQFG